MIHSGTPPPFHSARSVLVIGVGLTVIGGAPFNILPLLTAASSEMLGFSDRQAGILSLTLSGAAGASALLASTWVRSVNWRRAAVISLSGLLGANALSMLLHAYGPFVVLQGVSGFCASAAFSLGMTMLSDRVDSARSFGVATASQVLYQVLALLAGPALLRAGGMNAVLLLMAIPSGLAMSFIPRMPARGRALPTQLLPKGLLKPATVVAIAAFGAWFVNVGGYWTYIELIGQSRGMADHVIATCMAVGLMGGVVGGALSWMLGERFGRLWPIGVASALTALSAWLLTGSSTVLPFVISALIYVFAWNFSWAYQIAMVNAVDPSGRGVAVISAFGFIGCAVGAGLAALFVHPGHYQAVIGLEILGVGSSFLLFVLSQILHSGCVGRGASRERVPPQPQRTVP